MHAAWSRSSRSCQSRASNAVRMRSGRCSLRWWPISSSSRNASWSSSSWTRFAAGFSTSHWLRTPSSSATVKKATSSTSSWKAGSMFGSLNPSTRWNIHWRVSWKKRVTAKQAGISACSRNWSIINMARSKNKTFQRRKLSSTSCLAMRILQSEPQLSSRFHPRVSSSRS